MDPTLLQRLYGTMLPQKSDGQPSSPQDLRSSIMLSNPVQQMALASALQKLQSLVPRSPISISGIKPSNFSLLNCNFNPVLGHHQSSSPFISHLGLLPSNNVSLKPSVITRYQPRAMCTPISSNSYISDSITSQPNP